MLFTIASCSSWKKEVVKSKGKHKQLEILAQESLGDAYAVVDNSTAEYAIVFTKFKTLHDLFASVRFFVFEKKTGTKIFEDDLRAGTVVWKSDYVIVTTSREDGKKTMYDYHVKTKKVTTY